MAPLGLQITTVGALGGPGMMGDPGGSAVKMQFLWECGDWAGVGTLRPKSLAANQIDNNDMWDFSGIGTSNYAFEPQDDSTHADEGYWDIHTIGSPNLISITGCS